MTAEREKGIIKAIKDCNVRGEIDIHPKTIDVSGFAFDEKHINRDRAHDVSRAEAESFMKDAKFSSTRWNGRFKNYYSDLGAVFLDLQQNSIRTAFKSTEFTQNIIDALGELKKYER